MSTDRLALEPPRGTIPRFRRWWHRRDHDVDYQHLKFAVLRSLAITLIAVGPLFCIAAMNHSARWLCFAVAVPVFMNRFVFHGLVAPFGTNDEKIRNRVSSYGYVFFLALMVVQRALDAPKPVLQACLVLITVTAAVNFLADLKEFAPLWAKSGETFREARIVVPADQSEFGALLRSGSYVALHRIDDSAPDQARLIKYPFKPIVAEPLAAFLSTAAICLGYNILTAPFTENPEQTFWVMTPWFAATLIGVLLFPWQRRVARRFNEELARGRGVRLPADESLLGHSTGQVLAYAKILIGGALIMWEIIGLAWIVYPTPFSEDTQFALVLTIAGLSAVGLTVLLVGKDGRALARSLVVGAWRFVRRRIWVGPEAQAAPAARQIAVAEPSR